MLTKAQISALIDQNIKVNSARVSPTKTTGTMLKEVLVELNNSSPESGEYLRANTTSGLSDSEYINNFVTDYSNFNYNNIDPAYFLNGLNGNFFMDIFRAFSAEIQRLRDNAFNREAKFIVGVQLTNADLDGTNWWVADGTNNTDDMRGRYVVGGGILEGNNIPYDSTVGQHNTTLTISNVPEHRHVIQMYRAGASTDDIDSDVAAYIQHLRTPRAGGATVPGQRVRDGANVDIYTEFSGDPNPTESLDNKPSSITGTWIQYVIPDTQPPTVPTNLRTTNISGSSISIVWDSSSDDTAIRGYEVFVDNVQFGSLITSTSAFISGRTPDTAYDIKVRAVDLFNKTSDFTADLTATTLDVDITPPSTVSNLSASLVPLGSSDEYRVSLSWDRATDNEAVSNYIIERKIRESSFWNFHSSAGQTSSSTITFSPPVTYLADFNSTTYDFRVRARDAEGNFGGYSNISSITIPFNNPGGPGPSPAP